MKAILEFNTNETGGTKKLHRAMCADAAFSALYSIQGEVLTKFWWEADGKFSVEQEKLLQTFVDEINQIIDGVGIGFDELSP